MGASQAFANAYLATLNNPFEFQAIKLGYDCYVATDLGSAYLRSTINVNVDGTFALYFYPSVNAFVFTNNSGSAGVSWSVSPATNSTNISNSYGQARIVSGGIRCFANVGPGALTSGVLYSGSTPGILRPAITTAATATLVSLPQAEMGVGVSGAAALTRPVDNDSFVFLNSNISSTTTTYPATSPVFIVGTGFPSGTVIYYEAILNLEMMGTNAQGSIAATTNAPNSEPTAADYFGSPEALMSKIRPYLANSAVMDFAESAIATAVGGKRGAQTASVLRKMFSRTPHVVKATQSVRYPYHDELRDDPGRDENPDAEWPDETMPSSTPPRWQGVDPTSRSDPRNYYNPASPYYGDRTVNPMPPIGGGLRASKDTAAVSSSSSSPPLQHAARDPSWVR